MNTSKKLLVLFGISKGFALISFCAFLLFLILKLIDVGLIANWSWMRVFSPLIISVILLIIAIFSGILIAKKAKNEFLKYKKEFNF